MKAISTKITIKHFIRIKILSLALVTLFFCSSNTLAKSTAKFSISYLDTNNKVEKGIQQWLKESSELPLISDIINDTFKLKDPLVLVFGEKNGPLFDGSINEIHIPYDFMVEVEVRFKQAQYATGADMTNKDATMDALMHTIFHELAHALIAQFDLPVLGREEDAADGLASVLLIEYLEEGQEVVISAADLFDLESQDIQEYQAEDYWAEHSLDIQRYYSSMCHVYGSAPKAYKQIKVDEKFSDEKAENCIDNYGILVNSWLTVLEPYLKEE